MSAAPEKKTVSVPYVASRSFFNYRDHLREHPPLPSRIDKGVMAHLNYGTQQALSLALRNLGLIDSNDAPTKRLEAYVNASDEERQIITMEMIRDAYPFLLDNKIDMARVSPHEFEEKFKAATGATGSTAVKGISFFLALAEEAGMMLSPHLTKRKARSAGSPSVAVPKRTPRARKAKTKVDGTGSNKSDQQPITLSYQDQLLKKFPEFNPAWPKDIQEKWFEGFQKLMSNAPTTGSKTNGD
jgi:hypothetical protein